MFPHIIHISPVVKTKNLHCSPIFQITNNEQVTFVSKSRDSSYT